MGFYRSRDLRDPQPPGPLDAQACEWEHERNDQPLYDLATAVARIFLGTRTPTDEQIGWCLHDADCIIGDWDPLPDRWRVRRLPTGGESGEFDARIRVNDVTYVIPEGGKDTPGEPIRLATYRQHQREAEEVFRRGR